MANYATVIFWPYLALAEGELGAKEVWLVVGDKSLQSTLGEEAAN
jgi:hypothetical protein